MIKPLQALSTWNQKLVNSLIHLEHSSLERCVICLGPAPGLCEACRQDLPANHPACRRCALPLISTNTSLCGGCLARTPQQDSSDVPWRYQFPINIMITHYKYNGQRAFGRALAKAWTETTGKKGDSLPQALVPCPIAPERLRERGFNQSAELAHWLGRELKVPVRETLIRRRRGTRVQTGLNRRQRLKNLHGAFEVRAPAPSHIALVDDVVTTGATTEAMAQVLRQHGARRIEVWALARTP